jgi:hypothetical protein
MKNHRNLGFIIPLLHYAALAVAQNHVPEQAVNLGDASFLDGVAGPGIVVEEIADGTHGNEIVDANGHKVSGTGQLNSISVRDREPVTGKDNNILVSHPHFPPVGWACRQGPSACFPYLAMSLASSISSRRSARSAPPTRFANEPA